jgi:hypothetical protein
MHDSPLWTACCTLPGAHAWQPSMDCLLNPESMHDSSPWTACCCPEPLHDSLWIACSHLELMHGCFLELMHDSPPWITCCTLEPKRNISLWAAFCCLELMKAILHGQPAAYCLELMHDSPPWTACCTLEPMHDSSLWTACCFLKLMYDTSMVILLQPGARAWQSSIGWLSATAWSPFLTVLHGLPESHAEETQIVKILKKRTEDMYRRNIVLIIPGLVPYCTRTYCSQCAVTPCSKMKSWSINLQKKFYFIFLQLENSLVWCASFLSLELAD